MLPILAAAPVTKQPVVVKPTVVKTVPKQEQTQCAVKAPAAKKGKRIPTGNFATDIATGNVVVDFYAQWCGPCQRMHSIVDALNAEHDDVIFIKVDTDEQSDIATKYGIQSLPTFIFFKDGKQVFKKTGALSKAEFKKLIEKHF